jgi:Caspase domain
MLTEGSAGRKRCRKDFARRGLALLAIAATLSCSSLTVLAQKTPPTRGDRKLALKQVTELPAKGKRFALIIGVDEYQDTQISRLEGAANDEKALAEALVQYAGFPRDQVILLASDQLIERRPLRGNILQYLSNLKGIVPEDGLLPVSFAGHGIEREGRGFLCPTDARIGGRITLLEATAIPIETVRAWIRDIGVKQVLIILDACRNNPSGWGEGDAKLTESYACQFNFDVRNQEVIAFATLYATDVGNVAYEHKEKKQGSLTWALVEGLKGTAANEKGEVTLAGLRNHLQEVVPKRVRLDLGPEKKQRPYPIVEGYKAEELVVSISTRVTSADGSAPPALEAGIEMKLWDAVKDSKDPDDYKAYLAKYPNGAFFGSALNRIKNLESSESQVSQPKNEPKSAEPKTVASNEGSPPVAGKRPYEKERLLRVVQLNALPTSEIVQAIGQRGVEFKMSPDTESQVRGAGARSEVIEAMRANYRRITSSPPPNSLSSPSRPRSNVPSGPRLSKNEIITLLRSGVPATRVEQFVEARGVSFAITPQIALEIKNAGGNNVLIAAITAKANEAPVSSFGPAQPAPAVTAGPDYDELTDRAVAATQANNTNTAIDFLEQEIKIDSSKPQAHGLLGFAQRYGNHDILAAERLDARRDRARRGRAISRLSRSR